jgi:excisionase family DNA binding protein
MRSESLGTQLRDQLPAHRPLSPISQLAIVCPQRWREELLDRFFGLSSAERDNLFPSTTEAAKRVSLAQRTIQMWIDIGVIRAFRVGRNYHVDMESLRSYVQERALRDG